MSKGEKLILEILGFIIAAIGLYTQLHKEYGAPMIAVVDSQCWEAPKTVLTDLKKVGTVSTPITATPNRMTAEHATKTCCWYLVDIYNKENDDMEKPQMAVPGALHWEVRGKDEYGKTSTITYSERELITLPQIGCKKNIKVAVWMSCQANRKKAKEEIQITQTGHGKASVAIKTPVWGFLQSLCRHAKKVLVWFGVIFVLMVLIWRIYRARLKQQD